jgi:hypothetical protein
MFLVLSEEVARWDNAQEFVVANARPGANSQRRGNFYRAPQLISYSGQSANCCQGKRTMSGKVVMIFPHKSGRRGSS